ncbi:unnamed protein product [Discula destructiva]
MEVHLSGLPQYLPVDGLKKKLEPILADLNIAEDAFTCEKYRNQRWGNVTFVDRNQGQAFMNKHGQQLLPVPNPDSQRSRQAAFMDSVNGSVNSSSFKSKSSKSSKTPATNQTPRYKARLCLIGNEVFCSLSKSHFANGNAVPGQPNPITVRGLEYAREEKVKPTRKFEKEAAPNDFELDALACGHNVFDNGKLVFIPEVEWPDAGTAKFTKKTLLIKLNNGRVIRIPIDTVINVVCTSGSILNLTLVAVPAFFCESASPASAIRQLARLMAGMSLSDSATKTSTRVRMDSLDGQHAHVVGQSLVYQLRVSGTDLPRRMRALVNHDGFSFMHYPLITQRTPPLHLGASGEVMRFLMDELSSTKNAPLPFGILFQLQRLAYNAYLHPGTVLILTRTLRSIYKSDRDAGRRLISVDALKMLFKQCGWPVPHGDPSEFEVTSIVELLRGNEDRLRAGTVVQGGLLPHSQNLAYIHRANVTPSRITLHGPEPEAQNRILRKFPNHHEYFIRVQFSDENGQDLFFSPKISYDEVWNRFKSRFSQGIQVADRIYRFLGFSHSSLRSHSAWFSAPFFDDDGHFQTYETIIRALGKFSHIRTPAKCAARIGQAFSETPFSLPLDEYGIRVVEIPDVTSADGIRVFSDGVGTLSADVVDRIWEIIPQSKATPNAFQIRFRGSKGMLALDSRLQGSVVRLRPSMTKFDSSDKAILEICDMASKPIPLVLNRQMVKILEDMGVELEWFLQMQDIEVTRLREVTADSYNVADFLRRQKVGEGIRFHRLFRQAADLNLDWRKDAFLRSVVEAMVLRDLRLLKHKARIPISKGMTLFGIMDETGLLNPCEVYVTYDSNRAGNRYEPPPSHGQHVVVTRSPALHPGDIQSAKNIIPPQGHPLRDLSNVIVFSRHGQRDLPSQLSGGDLDGDIYNVIWDARAMPKQLFRPADYPRVEPLDLGREVTKEDMANFFVDFIKMDCLGVIAIRHMILADQNEEGTLHPDCLKLAELHSTAVDFSKTGKGVDFRDLPKANKCRPDFLAPGPETRIVEHSAIQLDEYILEPAPDEDEDQFAAARFEYYKSNKVLGHLYRAVDEHKIWKEDVQSKVRERGASFWDEFIEKLRPRYETLAGQPRGWEVHLETARQIRGWYEEAVSGAMAQYSEHPIKPLTELEVFIGNVVNKSGVQTNRQRDTSIKLGEEFDRISVWITKQMRRVSHDSEVPLTGYQSQYDNLHLCFACVHAGGKADIWQKGRDYANMQSFRVVAACALLAELRTFELARGGGYVGVR